MAWIQPVSAKASAEPYVVPLAVTDRSGLAGSVIVYKQRYLHVALDLTLSLSGEVAVLKESRRVRGTNYQYFDHPQFGAIVAVRRLAAEAAQAASSAVGTDLQAGRPAVD